MQIKCVSAENLILERPPPQSRFFCGVKEGAEFLPSPRGLHCQQLKRMLAPSSAFLGVGV